LPHSASAHGDRSARFCWKDLTVRLSKLFKALLSISLLALLFVVTAAQSRPDGARLLPEKVGDFRASVRTASIIKGPGTLRPFKPEDFLVIADEERNYVGADRAAFFVREIKTNSSSAAYSLLRHFAKGEPSSKVGVVDGMGVFGIAEENRIRFVKGDTFADVQDVSEQAKHTEAVRAFTKTLADTLQGDAGYVPALVMHLPEWEKKSNEEIGYAVSTSALQEEVGNQPSLDAVSFDEGTEAITARYGDARLVIIEFPTPQHSVDADARIAERIAQLRAASQPVPSGYKRVGNYSVFVFDAPDAAVAEKLISGVKYEKDVRWLGRNPHAEEIAVKRYTSTMGGVILTTLITTGLAILLSLSVGGIIGGAIFLYRRAKHTTQEIYSDAGGMLRLNIKDLNTPPPSTKLLRHGEEGAPN
jgi:hypothetical protein